MGSLDGPRLPDREPLKASRGGRPQRPGVGGLTVPVSPRYRGMMRRLERTCSSWVRK